MKYVEVNIDVFVGNPLRLVRKAGGTWYSVLRLPLQRVIIFFVNFVFFMNHFTSKRWTVGSSLVA